ncbi:MAG: SulP family inorganic anion transporter [Verrucomicrobiota bacterium]
MPALTPPPPAVNWRTLLFRGILPIDRSRLRLDIIAGITLAAMNIPQAMGYTKIAGTPAVTGLYTLLLPVIAFAVFGASRYLVVAADSATAAILAVGVAPLAAAGSPKYLALASMVALLAAGFLLLARLLRLGFLSDFLSRTVLIGFLTGVGIQVGIAVLGEMLGIEVHSRRTVVQLWTVLGKLPRLHWPTLAVSVGVVAVILGTRRFAPRLPGPLFAVGGAIALSAALDFGGHGIALLGPVAGGLPRLGFPEVSWTDVVTLLPTAGACFVMIVAQSSVTARAYATRHQQTLDENRDLLGLSAAEAAAAVSGTFVVNGSPTQTAMVETCGGRSQITHLTTAAAVALVLLLFTGPLRYLPICTLGAIVFVVAVHLIDVSGLAEIYRKKPKEFALAVTTTATVVVVGVEQGIILALVLSLLQHVRRSYQPHTALILRDPTDHWRMEPVATGSMLTPGLVMYWFGAELFYANAAHLTEETHRIVSASPSPVRWLVIDGGAITAIDFSAGAALKELQQDMVKQNVVLALTRVSPDLRRDLDRLELTALIGANHIFSSRKQCLRAYESAGGTGIVAPANPSPRAPG